MTTLRKAAQQAPVGWLESPHGAFRANPLYKIQFPSSLLSWQIPVFTALAEPEQEPVAWMFEARHIDTAFGPAVSIRHPGQEHKYMRNVKPLYTHPPRREWQGLTEEEIYPLYSEPSSDAEMVEFARAIEAALKEKNHE
jgi:hypothetical protein